MPSTDVDDSDAVDAKKQTDSVGLLHEMLRSFSTLARTLNLSHAVKELGSTRQTLRRHITLLEEAKGVELFTLKDRQYHLTEAGRSALPEAEDILARGRAWLRGQTGSHGGLQCLNSQSPDWNFYQQQQPLGPIWSESSPLVLRETFRAWTMSGGQIEHPCLSHVRPYLIIYRHTDAGWICVEFGLKSFYVLWFGLDFARSSIGRPISRMPAGEEFGRLLDQSFHEVEATQSVRLDHVYTQMPVQDGEGTAPMAYYRLMMGARFPDGSPSVLSLIVPTRDVNITALDASYLEEITHSVTIDFDPSNAKFEIFAETVEND